MTDARSSGLIFGVLILVQMVGGILVNFYLTAPLFGSPGFLVAAAAHAQQIGLSVLLGIVLGALSIVMAIIAFPVLVTCRARLFWKLDAETGPIASILPKSMIQ